MTPDIIMDHIDAGHFDDELGRMARSPEYAEHSLIELKSVLTDRVIDSMASESDSGGVVRQVRAVALLLIMMVLYIKLLLEIPLGG